MYNEGRTLELLEERNPCLSGTGFDLEMIYKSQTVKENVLLPSLVSSTCFVLSLIVVHAICRRVSCDPQLSVPDDVHHHYIIMMSPEPHLHL